VAKTEYKLDGGAWMTGTTLTVDSDGDHTLSYRSTDKAGNLETAKTAQVRIDRAPPTTSPSGADAAWHNASVTVTLRPTDATSGVATTEYRLDAGAWTPGTKVVVAAPADHSNDGVHTIAYHSTDKAGNDESVGTAQVRIDTTLPQTTLSGADAAWHTTGVTLDLTAGDAPSGVKTSEFRLDGGSWQATSQLTVSSDGVHSVDYRSTDNAGNVEAYRTVQVKVDKTAPITTQSGADAAWHTTGVTVTLSAKDATSGVTKTEYKLDGGAWTSGTQITVAAPADHSKDGTHTVAYRSADEAGNLETAKTVEVKIDTTAPVTTQSGTSGAWHKGPVTVTLTASDASSGVATTEYQLDTGAWTPGNQLTIDAPADHSNDGVHTIAYRSTDKIGNVEAVRTAQVKIDTAAPVTAAPKPASVRRGSTATLTYRVADALPNGGKAKVTIVMRTLGGKSVRSMALGLRPVNRTLTYRFVCNAARRTYRFFVYATDLAGNRQSVTGYNKLVVR
jgi:hypothetical protein